MIMQDFSYESRLVKYKDNYIQAYSIGSGDKVIFSFPSFPHSGLTYLLFLKDYNLTKFKFITFDLPGWIGYSENVFKNGDYDLEVCINIAKHILKEYSVKKFNVIGYSFGGALALKFAYEMEDSIDKIVLVSTIINSKIIANLNTVRAVKLLKKINKPSILLRIIHNRVKKFTKFIIAEGIMPEELLLKYIDMSQHINARVLLESIFTLFNSDLTEVLLNLKDKKDFLIVNSKDEASMFRIQAEFLRRHLDNEKSIYLHGTHDDFLLNPHKDVVKEVINFLIK